MSLTKSQKIMMDDGCPSALFLSSAARAAEWVAYPPPKTTGILSDPKTLERQRMLEVLQQQEFNRPTYRARSKAHGTFDSTGKRWDSLRNKWMPDPLYISTSTQGDSEMPKWKITCYNEAGEPISRGTSSIEEGLSQAEVEVKMGSVYHRQPAGSVKKILVTDAADGSIREWTEGMPDLPKPEDQPEGEAPEPAKGKGRKAKAEPAKAVKSKGKGPAKDGPQKGLKRPGVIAAVIEIIGAAKGCSVDEGVAILSKRFPDRKPDSMKSTFKIQANKNCTKKVKDEKRGVVYYRK